MHRRVRNSASSAHVVAGWVFAVTLVASGSIAWGIAPASGETLEDALAAAYLNNPRIHAQRANLRTSDEDVSQAVAGWRPTITVDADAGFSSVETVSNFGGGVSTTTEDNLSPRSFTFTLSEPLYRGGRTVAETRSAENLVSAGRSTLNVTEQEVLLDAVTAYMDVLRSVAEVDLSRNNERVVARQFEAAQDRFAVGEVTRTDVAQAEARLSQSKADRVAAEGDLISARAGYRLIMGDLPGTLVWPELADGLPADERESLIAGLRGNPAIFSADFAERAARENIDVALSDLLPEVTLQARFNNQFDTSSFTEESETASLLATVNIPLYQSGAGHSAVRQSKQVAAERRLNLEQARREVVEEVTRAWEALITAQARVLAFRSQVTASEIALDGVEQEAFVGLRTTLDVLDAEQELFEARVSLVRAQRDGIVSSYWLKASIGDLTASKLGLRVELYDPAQHYDAVRDRIFGLGAD